MSGLKATEQDRLYLSGAIHRMGERTGAAAERILADLDTLLAENARLRAVAEAARQFVPRCQETRFDEGAIGPLPEIGVTLVCRGHASGAAHTVSTAAYRLGVAHERAKDRAERCLVAQAVGMGADLYVTAHGVAYRVTVAKGRHMQRAYPDAADVPETLARLLGEVSR